MSRFGPRAAARAAPYTVRFSTVSRAAASSAWGWIAKVPSRDRQLSARPGSTRRQAVRVPCRAEARSGGGRDQGDCRKEEGRSSASSPGAAGDSGRLRGRRRAEPAPAAGRDQGFDQARDAGRRAVDGECSTRAPPRSVGLGRGRSRAVQEAGVTRAEHGRPRFRGAERVVGPAIAGRSITGRLTSLKLRPTSVPISPPAVLVASGNRTPHGPERGCEVGSRATDPARAGEAAHPCGGRRGREAPGPRAAG